MSSNDLKEYLEVHHIKLKAIHDVNSIDYIIKESYYAELLSSVGYYKESIPYYKDCYEKLKQYKNDDIYKNLYCTVGLQYAMALDSSNEFSATEAVFNDIMRVNPIGVHIGDYALFLHRRKRDFDRAEKFYRKALELYPNHSSIHLKYAGLLRHVRRDLHTAEKHYIKAVEVNNKNADAVGSYASFLHGVHGNLEAAEKYYQKAIEVDNTHTNNLCNYGLFLSEEKNSYDKAEEMYQRSLEVNPKHANTLYNYAVMLDTHLRRKPEAESFYRRALEIEPRHAYALYNLAVLLEERYSFKLRSAPDNNKNDDESDLNDRKEILSLYQRAVEADPRDSSTLADYGRFLLVRMDNAPKAEGILQAALNMDETCEIAMFNLGVLLHRHKHDDEAAELMLQRLLKTAPKHGAGSLQLARLLSERYCKKAKASASEPSATAALIIQFDKVCDAYEYSLPLLTEPGTAVSEFLKLVEQYGSNKQKLRIISTMGPFIDAQAKENAKKVIDHGTKRSIDNSDSNSNSSLDPSTIEQLNILQDAKNYIDKLKKTVISA